MALTPVAVGIATQTDINTPFMVAIVVGGAMFGDNLSFISDTTIVATRTQGCNMKDKFKVNSLIVKIGLRLSIFHSLSADCTKILEFQKPS